MKWLKKFWYRFNIFCIKKDIEGIDMYIDSYLYMTEFSELYEEQLRWEKKLNELRLHNK